MTGLFPPPLGAQISARFELLAPLRGDGAVLTFLAHDLRTGQRRAVTLFDPAHTQASIWADYARLVAAAAEAKVRGLTLPPQVPAAPPDPPHVIDEPPENRGLDRLRAQEGRIPWQRALAIGERIAGVLHGAVTATGVAHRALTPSRCTVDAHDEVEVLDYGVAEVELAGEQAEETEYRAPELRTGKGDQRSDVFSLTAIVYELISGTCPSGQPPPSLSSLVAVPPAVDRLLDQSLAPDPAQRLVDLATMRAALREILGLAPMPPSRQDSANPLSSTLPDAPSKSPVNPPTPRRPEPQPVFPIRPLSAAPTTRTVSEQRAPSGQVKHPQVLRPQHASNEPPIEGTERLPANPAQQDRTLLLPSADESHTERILPLAAARPDHSAEPEDARTEVFQRPLYQRSLQLDRTEKVSRTDQAPERTEVLSPLRTPSPQPDRTEVLSPLAARGASSPPDRTAVSDVRRAPPRTAEAEDEDRTLVMSRHDGPPAQSRPPSAPTLAPTLATHDSSARNRHRPEEALPSRQPLPPTLELPTPRMPPSERGPQIVLVAVNLALGLVLIGLLVCSLS